jgi:hypothetical protein
VALVLLAVDELRDLPSSEVPNLLPVLDGAESRLADDLGVPDAVLEPDKAEDQPQQGREKDVDLVLEEPDCPRDRLE